MSKHSSQKVAVIAGSGAIGSAIGNRLIEEGYEIVYLYHSTIPSQQHTLALSCDLKDSDSIEKAIQGIAEVYKRVDVCVLAASSPLIRKPLSSLSFEGFKDELAVPVFGTFGVVSGLLPLMKSHGGVIIGLTTAAVEGIGTRGNMGGYTVAKFAQKALLEELARELAPHNIMVHTVAPGFVRTPLQKDVPLRMDDFLKEKNPLKKLVTPEDVAEVVAFLCREKSRGLTGLAIPVTMGEVTP